MIIDIIIIISITILISRTIIFSLGSYIERNKKIDFFGDNEYPKVSVVVPARNEEENIESCINSISINNYPIENFEIVAVNDRSTDKTGEILTELSKKIENLKVVNIDEAHLHINLKGKPGALQSGIDEANGEIILMTDADCKVGPNWIKKISSCYKNKKIGFVASFTNIEGKGFFNRIQAIEWIYMHTLACAGIGLGQPLGCFGNNISVRKSDFDEIGGFEKIRFSVTEDLALITEFHKQGKGIIYLVDEDADIDTLPCRTLGEYLHQHHRWAVGGMELGWKAFTFVLSSISLWIGLIISIVTGTYFLASLFPVIRIIGDYIVVLPSIIRLKKHELIPWIIPSVIFFITLEIFVPFLLFKKTIKWKDQSFRRVKK
jgi:cellulose synthase/poly-beta-1,6-N-acetylglucosamine synthase-like glycosyltransferase